MSIRTAASCVEIWALRIKSTGELVNAQRQDGDPFLAFTSEEDAAAAAAWHKAECDIDVEPVRLHPDEDAATVDVWVSNSATGVFITPSPQEKTEWDTWAQSEADDCNAMILHDSDPIGALPKALSDGYTEYDAPRRVRFTAQEI